MLLLPLSSKKKVTLSGIRWYLKTCHWKYQVLARSWKLTGNLISACQSATRELRDSETSAALLCNFFLLLLLFPPETFHLKSKIKNV